ncbi:MAG: hypothetical protein ACO3EK_15405, partial [Alphaproteobacteria bacterium]
MMNLADALAHHVRARTDRPAIVQGDRVVLYRDLDGSVRRGARAWVEPAEAGDAVEEAVDGEGAAAGAERGHGPRMPRAER